MEQKLSVIVPVYNAEKYLSKCVNSILNQTYSNIELLLINDGSKDGSLELCYEFAKKDNRIKVFDKPNGGAASARNLGIREATGSYIGFCDADDWLEMETYQNMIEIIEREKGDVVRFLSNTYDKDGNLLERGEDSRDIEIVSSREILRKIYAREGDVSLATRVFKAEVVKQIEIPEGRRVEDFFFSICLYNKIEKDILYKYPFYNYTENPKSVTHSATGDIYFDALYFFDRAKRLCKYRFKEEEEYHLLKLYYLISISLNRKEHKEFRQEIIKIKKDLKEKKECIDKNGLLNKKEKKVLKLACLSFRLPRLLYCIKNWRK